MEGRLSGKTAVITGASSGIGGATALLFAGEGARLVLADMNEEQLARVRDEIAAKGEGNHQEDRRVVGERGQRLVRPCH